MSTLFDAAMDYERVQRFFKLYRRPHTRIALDIVGAIRGFGRKRNLAPQDVLAVLADQDSEHERIFEQHEAEALYVVEYYMAWERLSKKEKDAIQLARYESWRDRELD